MALEIYLDILFLENVVINYFILNVTAKFTKNEASSLRLLTGALVGAIYVVILVLFPDIKAFNSVFAKILLSFVIVALTFFPVKIVSFIKQLSAFYVSTFIFAGAAFAFLYLSTGNGFVKSGMIYVFWQSKWSVMFLSLAAVGIIVKVFWEVLQCKLVKEKLIMPIRISFETGIVSAAALVDTGNSLLDPLTRTPVVVIEFDAIKQILPHEICSIFESSMEDDFESVTDIVSKSEWYSRFRVIPFTSLGKENGILLGFKPDYIEIGDEQTKKDIKNVIIGIYNKALSNNSRYNALLGPELVG